MATEITAVLRFAGLPPEDLERLLEDTFDCDVMEMTEEEV